MNDRRLYVSAKKLYCPVGITEPTDAEVIVQMHKEIAKLHDFNTEKCWENADLVSKIEKLEEESITLGDVVTINCGDINQKFKITKLVINYGSTANPTIQIDGVAE